MLRDTRQELTACKSFLVAGIACVQAVGHSEHQRGWSKLRGVEGGE